MLVNCPRCGFTQPKDKYCAQCGVDTETFRPPKESSMASLKRHLTNPLLFLGIAVIACVFLFKSFQRPNSESLSARVQFLKGSSQVASTNNQSNTSAAETSSREIASTENANPTVAAMGAEAQSPATSGPSEASLVADAPMTPAATSTTGALASGKLPVPPTASTPGEDTTVTLYYAEVPTRALERIFQESQSTGQFNTFGDYTAGILPDVEKRILAEALKITVHQKTVDTIGRMQKFWPVGMQDEHGEHIGLTTYIELADAENNSFRGNLEVMRSWRSDESGTATSVQKTSFPAIFELNPGAGFFIARIMPRKSNLPLESGFSSKGAFQILNSDAFKNNASEFVIFIEFKKKP